MNPNIILLAEKFSFKLSDNSGFRQWMSENPGTAAGLALVVGVALTLWGGYDLMQGNMGPSYNEQTRKAYGLPLAVGRVVAGIGLCGFAAYTLGS